MIRKTKLGISVGSASIKDGQKSIWRNIDPMVYRKLSSTTQSQTFNSVAARNIRPTTRTITCVPSVTVVSTFLMSRTDGSNIL